MSEKEIDLFAGEILLRMVQDVSPDEVIEQHNAAVSAAFMLADSFAAAQKRRKMDTE